MSLDFTKVNYVDGSTIIEADNLNDIQDAILALDSNKVESESGKGLSTEDYTSAEKSKLSGIQAGAQVNPGNATTSVSGLMSSVDKIKLDGIATGATAVTIDSTLTVEGQAADAKATGDALAEKYEKPSGGIPDSDIASASTWNAKGTYSKPSGGIPKTDLASAVQTSLNKANAAIQLGLTGAAVGDLVRVGAVYANGKPTRWSHVPLCNIVTNQNLLDNWYFVGGGSQQGGGQFPINQRGLTTYPNADFSIDRWKNTSGTLSISQNGISLSAIQQPLEKTCIVDGLNYTMSVYCSLGLLTVTHSLDSSISGWQISSITTGGLWTGVRYANGVWEVKITSTDSTVLIYAAKLEIGSEQTIAHQEGNTWVLNEIPDYGQELAKCQRYLIVFKTSSNTRSFLALGYAFSTSQYRAVLPTPVTMKHSTNRPVELTGTVTAGSLTASSIGSYWEENPGSVTLFVNVDGATVGNVAPIVLENGGTLIISAE